MTIQEILEQAKILTPQERAKLVQQLQALDVKPASTSRRRLSELRGLGKAIWKDVDPQDYIHHLRDEWDDLP